MTIHTIDFNPPLIVDIVKPRTEQHVECLFEECDVAYCYQHALDSYTYFAIAKLNNRSYPLEAHSDRFIDNVDELESLRWMFPPGTQFPKMISLSHINWKLEKVEA